MELAERKHPRLSEYDYSQPGAYFVTINTEGNLPILSAVGRGLAPAEPLVTLTALGEIAEHELLALETRYSHMTLDKYVIMPTHIHILLSLTGEAAGASPRPTVTDTICAYKSIATRKYNAVDGCRGRRVFQTSFYEHVVREDKDFYSVWQYIDQNPEKWAKDEYYAP